MKTLNVTFEEFKAAAEAAALNWAQAEAMAYLAEEWFGKAERNEFLAYWKAENEE